MFDVIPNVKNVVIVCGKSDLRCGITGLAALVNLRYGLDPLKQGTLFLFCGNKRDRIKGLLYSDIGFYLIYIRLTNGVFQWPRNSDEARDISPEQYQLFFNGFTIDSSIKSYQRIENLEN